jgi:3-oxoacyl-[acyl-carrier protein] reductase
MLNRVNFNPDWDQKDRVAVISGATGYLGRALSRGFAEADATLVLTSRRQEALDRLAGELALPAERIFTVAADLTEHSAGERIIATALEKAKRIDTLVINAGTLADGLVAGQTDENWARVHEVNVHGAFRLLQAGLRPMILRRSGSVVVVSSTAAHRPNAGQAAYAASKAALEMIVRVAARETASRGIRVNGVAPGLLAGGMASRFIDEAADRALAAIPMGRLGEANEVVPIVLFLASPMSSYITGQIWCIDGGLTA